MTYDSMALLSKTISKQSPDLDNLEEPHRPKQRSDGVPTIFFVLAKIKVRRIQRSAVFGINFHQGRAQVNAYGLGLGRHSKRSGAFSKLSRIEESLGCLNGRPTP